MNGHDFDDETLMAFADGELDEAAAARVERAIADDEELAARVALFMETRDQARAALAPLLDTPVPEALRRSVEEMVERAREEPRGEVVRLRTAANDARPSRSLRWIAPVAASAVAVLAGLTGYWLGASGQPGQTGLVVAELAVDGLPAVLDGTPSGEEIVIAGTDSRFRAIATFENEAGALCREFELDTGAGSTLVSVACLADDAWKVNFATVASGGQDGYAPASSLEALDAYLGAIGAGEPMSAQDEAAALARLR